MAATNYTPIQLYYSTTAAAVPVNTNLASGELAINITDGKLYYKNNAGTVTLLSSAAGASGDVVGPSSATDNALARFDLTTGKLIQNSVGILSDAGILTGLTGITSSGSITFSSLTSGRVPYATTGGLLTDSANLLYSGTDLTVYGITVGRGAGAVSTNTAVGASALAAVTTQATTTAIGYQAGQGVTSGSASVFVGDRVSTATSTSLGVTGVGSQALQVNNGNYNTGIGFGSLNATNSGANNTAVGASALQANTTASNNTAVGYQALYTNTAFANTAVGASALYSNTTAIGNNAFGYFTLYANSTGAQNCAFGGEAYGAVDAAMRNNTTGSYNVAMGVGALKSNTTASNNTAVGYQAGYSNATGSRLSVLGYQAAYGTTANANTAIGYQALYTNSTGFENTAVGDQSMYSNTTGYYNVAVGRVAGYSSTTGILNTYIGRYAGYSMTTGSQNTILGGYNGNQGGLDIRTADNYIVLSDGDGNPRGYFTNAGAFHVPTMAVGGTANLHWSSGAGQFFVTSSSRRFKHDIVEYDKGLAELMQMQPKYFVYNDEPNQKQRAGFIAEDFHDLGMTEYVEYWKDDEGNDTPSEIGYSNMVAILVKSIQELKAEVDSLKSQLNGA